MASLLEKFMSIKDAWRQLARSSIAHERWVAITALYGDRIPRSFAEELVLVALDDKSSKIRFFAVERVYTQKLKALLPKLKERISLEKDAKVAKHIQWVLNMLERGYHIHAPNAKGVGGSIDLQVDDSEIAAATLPLQKVQGHNKKAREID